MNEYQIGLIYNIDGEIERIQTIHCRGGNIYINNVTEKLVTPAELDDRFFEIFDFKYYNGWYLAEDEHGQTLLFTKTKAGYVVSLDTTEIDGLLVNYIHQAQRLIYSLKGVAI